MGENEDIEVGLTVKIGDLVSLYETEQKSFLYADYIHVSGRPKPKDKNQSIENFQGKLMNKSDYNRLEALFSKLFANGNTRFKGSIINY
jgi:hypothetical protein